MTEAAHACRGTALPRSDTSKVTEGPGVPVKCWEKDLKALKALESLYMSLL